MAFLSASVCVWSVKIKTLITVYTHGAARTPSLLSGSHGFCSVNAQLMHSYFHNA